MPIFDPKMIIIFHKTTQILYFAYLEIFGGEMKGVWELWNLACRVVSYVEEVNFLSLFYPVFFTIESQLTFFCKCADLGFRDQLVPK